MKKAVQYMIWNLKTSFTDKRIFAGYLIGILSIIKQSINFRMYTGSHTINVSECFIVSSRQTGLYIIGAIIILSDAPFINSGSFVMIHRIKRNAWYKASWMYMFTHMLIYYGTLVIASILPFITKAYPENEWSLSVLWMKGGMTEKMNKYNIAPVSKYIFEFKPLATLIITITLLILYSMIYTSLMFSLNLFFDKKMAGTFAAGGVVILSEFIHKQMVYAPMWVKKLSLYRNYLFTAFYNPSNMTVSFSLCYMGLIVFIAYVIGEIIIPRSEFILTY
ncbi:hypothetical protein SAMN04487934_1175 [Eubacterium ruminantium]|nr:hypothetical protein SAMN04487934_1175 [Eubacterium ruminantium]